MKVRVKCTIYLDVEVGDQSPHDILFDLVENHCPGTGRVGAAFDALIEECDAKSVCWACNAHGVNEIVGPPELVEALAAR